MARRGYFTAYPCKHRPRANPDIQRGRFLTPTFPHDGPGHVRRYPDLAPALRRALLPEDSQAAGSKGLATLPKLGSAGEASGVAAGGLQAGARAGPCELIRPLGTGGMAQVWLARRADGAVKREVALKLPTLTHLRADLERRFVRERDILASLEHPISRVSTMRGLIPMVCGTWRWSTSTDNR